MLCPAALALRAVSTTQAERQGAASNSQHGIEGRRGLDSQRQGERSYLLGQVGLLGSQWTHTALILCSWSQRH